MSENQAPMPQVPLESRSKNRLRGLDIGILARNLKQDEAAQSHLTRWGPRQGWEPWSFSRYFIPGVLSRCFIPVFYPGALYVLVLVLVLKNSPKRLCSQETRESPRFDFWQLRPGYAPVQFNAHRRLY